MSAFYIQSELDDHKISVLGRQLKSGKIGVFLSDTVYGIFTTALNRDSVEKVYTLRRRNPDKPLIILISSLNQLGDFGILPDDKTKKFLNTIWPGPVSVVLPCAGEKWEYLHRGSYSLAFRIPENKFLLKLLNYSGPVVAPSANLEGEPTANNVDEAKSCFGESVDFYIDAEGAPAASASTVIRIVNDEIEILRQGENRINQTRL